MRGLCAFEFVVIALMLTVSCTTAFQQHTYKKLEVGELVPTSVVTRQHEVCFPSKGHTSLSDYDYLLNGGERYLTVIGHYYAGCTPGREDQPAFSRVAEQNQLEKVAFLETLKNGINDETCAAWGTIEGSASGGTFPKIVNDQDRSLVYAFFNGPEHPAYVVLDHCMVVRAELGSLTNGTSQLNEILSNLTAKIDESCSRTEHVLDPTAAAPSATATANVTCAPLFGIQRTIYDVADSTVGLSNPRDLNFHPVTGALWVANSRTDGMIKLDVNQPQVNMVNDSPQMITAGSFKTDRAHYHYMDKISSFSFSDTDAWFATCQESANTYEDMMKPNFFMGPSLFEDAQTEGKKPMNVDQQGRACGDAEGLVDPAASETCFFTHSDMLHAAPQCMGIVHDKGARTPYNNVYWAFDGHNGSLVRFDFEKPHYPGSLEHSLANVRRFPEIALTRTPGVVGHLVVDSDNGMRTLYIADTGANRVIAMNADSGRFNKHARNDLGGDFDTWSSEAASFEYSMYTCAEYTVLANVSAPSGMVVHGNVLYVASHTTGKIHALHKTSGAHLMTLETDSPGAVMGLAVNPEGTEIYFADGPANKVRAVRVTTGCSASETAAATSGHVAAVHFDDLTCPAPEETTLGVGVAIEHDVGYLNTTNMFDPAYGTSADCLACNDKCNNDMLLMTGYLCHACLPNPCQNNAPCANIIGKGYTCECSGPFGGDHCQTVATAAPTKSAATMAPSMPDATMAPTAPMMESHSTNSAMTASVVSALLAAVLAMCR